MLGDMNDPNMMGTNPDMMGINGEKVGGFGMINEVGFGDVGGKKEGTHKSLFAVPRTAEHPQSPLMCCVVS